jgi:hypothetical protein
MVMAGTETIVLALEIITVTGTQTGTQTGTTAITDMLTIVATDVLATGTIVATDVLATGTIEVGTPVTTTIDTAIRDGRSPIQHTETRTTDTAPAGIVCTPATPIMEMECTTTAATRTMAWDWRY